MARYVNLGIQIFRRKKNPNSIKLFKTPIEINDVSLLATEIESNLLFSVRYFNDAQFVENSMDISIKKDEMKYTNPGFVYHL